MHAPPSPQRPIRCHRPRCIPDQAQHGSQCLKTQASTAWRQPGGSVQLQSLPVWLPRAPADGGEDHCAVCTHHWNLVRAPRRAHAACLSPCSATLNRRNKGTPLLPRILCSHQVQAPHHPLAGALHRAAPMLHTACHVTLAKKNHMKHRRNTWPAA